MKTPITVRVESGLLDAARRCAAVENRTLTNFIETVLRRRIAEMAAGRPAGRGRSIRHTKDESNDAA